MTTLTPRTLNIPSLPASRTSPKPQHLNTPTPQHINLNYSHIAAKVPCHYHLAHDHINPPSLPRAGRRKLRRAGTVPLQINRSLTTVVVPVTHYHLAHEHTITSHINIPSLPTSRTSRNLNTSTPQHINTST